ncbi:MAG: hypothetical protein EOP71_06835, partial [Variovorax sp.]
MPTPWPRPRRPSPRKARPDARVTGRRARGTAARRSLPSSGRYIDPTADKESHMGQKLKITGWVAAGAVAGVLTTVSLQTV